MRCAHANPTHEYTMLYLFIGELLVCGCVYVTDEVRACTTTHEYTMFVVLRVSSWCAAASMSRMRHAHVEKLPVSKKTKLDKCLFWLTLFCSEDGLITAGFKMLEIVLCATLTDVLAKDVVKI